MILALPSEYGPLNSIVTHASSFYWFLTDEGEPELMWYQFAENKYPKEISTTIEFVEIELLWGARPDIEMKPYRL